MPDIMIGEEKLTKAELASLFCDDVTADGSRFVRSSVPGDDDGAGYWLVPYAMAGDECEPEQVGGPAWIDRVVEKANVSPMKADTKHYTAEAQRRCRIGVRADEIDFAAPLTERPGLHVHLGRGVVVRVDGSGISAVPQLTDEAGNRPRLFVPMSKMEPLNYYDQVLAGWETASHDFTALRSAMLDAMPHDQYGRFSQAEQAAIVLAWWLGIFLGPMVQGRPILALTGVYGSGKSMFGRMLGTAFYGPEYEVSGGLSGDRAMKDIAAAMVERPCVIRDDMNNVPEDITDLLCRVATGATIELAAFHETLARVEYNMRASLAITSIRPSWALREDLLSRLLALRFARPVATPLTEDEMIAKVADARPAIWTETLKALAWTFSIGSTYDEHLGEFATRFRSWERWVRRAALIGGWLAPLHSALHQMRAATVDLAADADPTLAALRAIAEGPGKGRLYTASELYDVVSMYFGQRISEDPEKRPSAQAARSPRAMGQFLARIETIGSTVCVVQRAGRDKNQVLWSISPKA